MQTNRASTTLMLSCLLSANLAAAEAVFPSPQEQLASFAPYEESRIDGAIAASWLESHQVLLLNQAHEVADSPRQSVAGGAGYGCATPLTDDGYLLSARHAVSAPLLALRWLGEQPELKPARLVWAGSGACDLALIKVDWSTPQVCCSWSAAASMPCGTVLLAAGTSMAEDDQHQWFVRDRYAGALSQLGLLIAPNQDDPSYLAMDATLLAHPGDSGGPVVTADGQLVGVMVAHLLNRDGTSTGTSRLLRPDPAAIAQLIGDDRAQHMPHPTVGTMATVIAP